MLIECRRSALLLIDVQERLIPAMDGAVRVIEHASILVRAARRLGIPVIATRQYPKGLGDIVAPLKAELGEAPVHDKLAFSAFADETIRAALRELGRDQFVVAGVEGHVCVLQTVLDLLTEGYGVAAVADAIASRRPDNRSFALDRMARHGTEIVSTEMVLFEWLEKAGTDEFRELSALIR